MSHLEDVKPKPDVSLSKVYQPYRKLTHENVLQTNNTDKFVYYS